MRMEATTNPLDDCQLMAAIAARDRDAFSVFYDRHSSLVFALCLRILRDRASAEDALIDIFEEVWEKSARFDAALKRTFGKLVTN